jgi:MFS transporter, DHA2 family, multidrug resistance protein
MAGSVFLPVGIIQGFVAPMAGLYSNKIGPKTLIIGGAVLLALSFYLNSFMSYLTEQSFIMVTLYLRGVAMGMMFSPLTAIAVIDIPREKMGQASGLINVIRQVGGSFGVAILTTILTSRFAYHSQLYGEALDKNSPALQSIARNIGHYITFQAGNIGSLAEKQSQAIISSHISRQAFVQAIDDDFLLASIITLVSSLPVIFLKLRKKEKKQTQLSADPKPRAETDQKLQPIE